MSERSLAEAQLVLATKTLYQFVDSKARFGLKVEDLRQVDALLAKIDSSIKYLWEVTCRKPQK